MNGETSVSRRKTNWESEHGKLAQLLYSDHDQGGATEFEVKHSRGMASDVNPLLCPHQCTDEWALAWRGFPVTTTTDNRKSWEAPSWHYLMGLGTRAPLGSSDFWHLLARLELSGWSMVEASFAVSNDALREVAGQAVELTAIERRAAGPRMRLWVLPTRGRGSQRCSLPFWDPSREDTNLVFPMASWSSFLSREDQGPLC